MVTVKNIQNIFLHSPFDQELVVVGSWMVWCDAHTQQTVIVPLIELSLVLLNHTQLDANGRTPLNEWSARCRSLYLHNITQRINTREKHPCTKRDSNPSTKRPETYTLDRVATGIRIVTSYPLKNRNYESIFFVTLPNSSNLFAGETCKKY